ncbi:hypothetical protein Tco_1460417, partial [Tanacetum coccineum]
VDNTAKTRRPQPRSNTKNDRVPSASKNTCSKNKEVKVEEHPSNLLLSKNKKHMSSECNNIKLAIQNDKYEVVKKPKKAGFTERLASPKPSKPRMCLRYLKLLINFVWKFLGTVYFGNDHVAIILGFGDLQWGNILITKVYFVEGLGHNLFSVGQFCDSDLRVYNQRTKKIMETMNVTFDELSTMAFEQSSLKASKHEFWTNQFRTRSSLCSVNNNNSTTY